VTSPRVSVLLPVRNAEATLPECLASLRAQTLAGHEIVAVDDGSCDASAALLEAAAREEPRLRVVRSQHRGVAAALNHAASLARAPLLARMDADDVCHPERLRLQAQAFAGADGLDVLGCRVRVLDGGSGTSRGMRAYVAWSNGLTSHAAILRDLFVESPLVHPSVMMRASALRALGGYRDYAGPEDYDLWLRAARAGMLFAKLEPTLLAWRDHAARLTRNDPRYSEARFRERKLEALIAGPLAAGRGVVVWGAGRIGKAWARALERRARRPLAFCEVDPRKLGQRIYDVPVLSVEAAVRLPGALHLAAVGAPGARERIRSEAARRGLAGHDLVAVA
jgi:glycosyltransferase involved in cell wall biosynthesis